MPKITPLMEAMINQQVFGETPTEENQDVASMYFASSWDRVEYEYFEWCYNIAEQIKTKQHGDLNET